MHGASEMMTESSSFAIISRAASRASFFLYGLMTARFCTPQALTMDSMEILGCRSA